MPRTHVKTYRLELQNLAKLPTFRMMKVGTLRNLLKVAEYLVSTVATVETVATVSTMATV